MFEIFTVVLVEPVVMLWSVALPFIEFPPVSEVEVMLLFMVVVPPPEVDIELVALQ